MGLEAPVGAGIETGGGEGALDAELVLLLAWMSSATAFRVSKLSMSSTLLILGAVSGDVLGRG